MHHNRRPLTARRLDRRVVPYRRLRVRVRIWCHVTVSGVVICDTGRYTCEMSRLQETGRATYRVSARGQLSLPADARRRWGLEEGGAVELFDLGDCVVMLPTGMNSARASLARALPRERYRRHVDAIGDPDLREE